MPGAAVLESEDLTIRFGGHAAVDAVSCRFEPGTLTAIVGPNGAGKTTYFNLLSGQLRATAGRVRLGGRDITALPASGRANLGLGRAFQLTQLFPRLTVGENVRLAVQARRGIGLSFGSIWSDHRELIERAEAIIERIALGARRETAAALLPHGDQRKLEVAMLMALEPAVYLFDEPTAGMSVDEAPIVLSLIEAIKRDPTRTVVLVEHKLDVVRSLSDRVVVFHQGRKVADGSPAEVMASAIVREAYLGEAP